MADSREAERPALRGARLAQLVSLYNDADALYKAGRNQGSVQAFRRVKLVAKSLKEPGLVTRARFFEGAALHGAGRLHEALAVFAPSVAAADELASDPWVYMTVTRYVLIAVELPLSLAQIESAIAETKDWLRQSCAVDRRSRLLLVEARLARARGRHRQALRLAQEAFERSRTEQYTFSCSTYLRTLVDLCVELGELDLGYRYLDRWDVLEGHHLTNKAILMASARSNLLRREGRVDEALEWGRRAVADARHTEELPTRVSALRSLVRAMLCAGYCDQVRDALAELLRLRRSSVGEMRFEVRLLAGDYQLARARGAVGLAPMDLEFANSVLDRTSVGSGEAAERTRNLARRHYQSALAVGGRIDEALDCQTRAEIVAPRFEVLGRV